MTPTASSMGTPATTENCRFCWMCRHVCPVGRVTARETLTPHAWALAIESVKRGQLQWTRDSADVMFACADCGLCRTHCVTDQPLPDAIVAARAAVVDAGLAAPAVRDVDERLASHANPYAPVAPIASDTPGDVALFVGDAAHLLDPASVDAAVMLLGAAGVAVTPVGRGRSSGLLASTLGLQTTAVALARAVVAEVEASGAREVVVLTPGDRWTFEHVYPARLGVAWPAAVSIRSAVDVLHEALRAGGLSFRPPAGDTACAYHDPCHAPRSGRDETAPRELLGAALGGEGIRELFWRGQRAHPCGATGGLEFTHPDIAAGLAASRLQDARAAGARLIVTEDAGCVAHLGGQRDDEVVVRNLYEVLAERLVR